MTDVITNDLGVLSGKVTRTGTIAPAQQVQYNFEIGRKTGIEHSARLTFNDLKGLADLDLILFRDNGQGGVQINQSTTAKAI